MHAEAALAIPWLAIPFILVRAAIFQPQSLDIDPPIGDVIPLRLGRFEIGFICNWFVNHTR